MVAKSDDDHSTETEGMEDGSIQHDGGTESYVPPADDSGVNEDPAGSGTERRRSISVSTVPRATPAPTQPESEPADEREQRLFHYRFARLKEIAVKYFSPSTDANQTPDTRPPVVKEEPRSETKPQGDLGTPTESSEGLSGKSKFFDFSRGEHLENSGPKTDDSAGKRKVRKQSHV